MRDGRTRWLAMLAITAAAVGLVLAAGCSKTGVSSDKDPPAGTMITNPEDGASLSSQTINVRGRAEVGATVEIMVNGESKGTALASPAVPDDGGLGRFTVVGVHLGDEGAKTISAAVTDLYGNRASENVEIDILLDMTAPPVAFEPPIEGAELDPISGNWSTGLPALTLVGITNTTADGTRVRYGGINEFLPTVYDTFEAPPGPDAVRFWVPLTTPPLTVNNPDSLIRYYVEAFDYAGNVSSEQVSIDWVAEGKDTTLTWDDGSFGSINNQTTGQSGMKLATLFQAPTWANYVIGIHFFIMNDDVDNPNDPEAPSTKPFRALVWRPNQDILPGVEANEGLNPGDLYPEEAWLELVIPNAVNISNDTHFPDKQFFVGMEWLHRSNPVIGLDDTYPIDFKTYRNNWSLWEPLESHDAMIRAIVSDVPAGELKRTAVLRPVRQTAEH